MYIYYYYQGAVTKVKIRDECLGGSAHHNAKNSRKGAGHPILNGFREMFRGSFGKKGEQVGKRTEVGNKEQQQQQQLHNNTNSASAQGGGRVASPPPSQVYALKSIQLDRISPLFLKELENEIDILRTLDHPNIVKAHEVYWSGGGKSHDKKKNKQIYVVLDCCDGGDLYERQPYSERQSARITTCLVSAIKYMHDHGIVHRGE
jgi:serine/threonine protein kinase